jgi:hypothetical protein
MQEWREMHKKEKSFVIFTKLSVLGFDFQRFNFNNLVAKNQME